MSAIDPQQEVPQGARFYTRARRIPKLVGRLHDGTKIPGGPYTFVQLVSAGVVGFVLWQTKGAWAHYGWFVNGVIFVVPVVAVLFLTRLVPTGGRNPFGWVAGVAGVSGAPSAGRIDGQRVTVRGSHQVVHRICVVELPADSVQASNQG